MFMKRITAYRVVVTSPQLPGWQETHSCYTNQLEAERAAERARCHSIIGGKVFTVRPFRTWSVDLGRALAHLEDGHSSSGKGCLALTPGDGNADVYCGDTGEVVLEYVR